MLPVGPAGPGNSPYSALSAFAGSPVLVSLERLVDDGLLRAADIVPVRGLHEDRVSYAAVTRYKLCRLRRAFAAFSSAGGLKQRSYVRFCDSEAHWLDDHAHYAALRRAHGGQPWTTWPMAIRKRSRPAPRRVSGQPRSEIDLERFIQYVFDRQWTALRRAAHQAGVGLIGDIPIFVAHDSSDVWAHPELFQLDASGRAKVVSGVPPDLFSRDGQRWGHPHYQWARHRSTGFAWWVARFRRALAQFDAVRIDHFLGFHRVWAVPGRARTARRGKWLKTPGGELFSVLRRRLGSMQVIAEDLGLVTPEAEALRDRFGFPGMRILQFAFGEGEESRHNQPHSYPHKCVVYPGTHDNDTIIGWIGKVRRAARRRKDGSLTELDRVLRYTGTSGRTIHWDLIRLALLSPANLAVIPLQDVLGLDNSARMNTPATKTGNWQWRVRRQRLVPRVARRLRELTDAYGRLPAQPTT